MRGWTFWANGSISLESAEATDDNVKVKLAPFCEKIWSGMMGCFLKKIVKNVSSDAMDEIIELAQAPCVPKCRQGSSALTMQVDVTFNKDDLVEGSHASSDSASANGDPLFGWVPGCTKDRGSWFTFLLTRS